MRSVNTGTELLGTLVTQLDGCAVEGACHCVYPLVTTAQHHALCTPSCAAANALYNALLLAFVRATAAELEPRACTLVRAPMGLEPPKQRQFRAAKMETIVFARRDIRTELSG